MRPNDKGDRCAQHPASARPHKFHISAVVPFHRTTLKDRRGVLMATVEYIVSHTLCRIIQIPCLRIAIRRCSGQLVEHREISRRCKRNQFSFLEFCEVAQSVHGNDITVNEFLEFSFTVATLKCT